MECWPTFAESVNVASEVVDSLLAIHELSKAVHKAISLVFAVVGPVRELNFVAALNTFGYDVGCESLCENKQQIVTTSLLVTWKSERVECRASGCFCFIRRLLMKSNFSVKISGKLFSSLVLK